MFMNSTILVLLLWLVIAQVVCGARNLPERVLFEQAKIMGEDYIRPLGASKLAPPITTVSCSNQQVHISLGDQDDEVFITYASLNSSKTSFEKCLVIGESYEDVATFTSSSYNDYSGSLSTSIYFACDSQSYSQLIWITGNLYEPAMGAVTETASYILSLQNTSVWAYSYVNGTKMPWGNYRYYDPTANVTNGLMAYNNPYMVYDSPIIKTATIQGLTPGTTYYYKPMDSCTEVFEFTLPRKATGELSDYPMTVGISVDLGQTLVSNASINALITLDPEVIILSGDLSYADGWYPRWDSFSNLIEPLASKIPILTTGGNHEFSSSESWLSYFNRFPTPYKGSGSTNNCYYGKEVGVMHVITLCSYAGYFNTSMQYSWLSEYLSTSINRTRTPWLVTMMHVPWYSSNSGHWMEGELMRRSMEQLLYDAGVDLFIVGHVHVYERTLPVFNNEVNECGPIHMTIGDGGNYEGTYVTWLLPQPSWSAFRESSFGVGELQFINESVAQYSWHRHACQSNGGSGVNHHINFSDSCVSSGDNSAYRMLTSDVLTIKRPSKSSCPNRYVSTATHSYVATSPTASPVSSPSDDDSNNTESSSKRLVIGLIIATVILGLSTLCLGLILITMVYFDKKPKSIANIVQGDVESGNSLTSSSLLSAAASAAAVVITSPMVTMNNLDASNENKAST